MGDYDVVELLNFVRDFSYLLVGLPKTLKEMQLFIAFSPQARNYCLIFFKARMRVELQICFSAINC